MSILNWLKSLLFRAEEENTTKQEPKLDFDMPVSNPKNSTSPSNTPIFTNQPNSKLEEFSNKAKDFVESTGNEIASQGTAIWGAVKEKMEDLDEGTKEFRENMKNKAQDALEKIDDFVDKTIATGKELEVKEEELDANRDGIADHKPDFGKTLEEKHEGFFEKAEKWLDKNEPKSEVQQESNEISESKKPTLELPID